MCVCVMKVEVDLFRGTKRVTKSGEKRVLEIGVHAQHTVHTSMKVTLHSTRLGMVTTQDDFFFNKKIAKSQVEKKYQKYSGSYQRCEAQGMARGVKLTESD